MERMKKPKFIKEIEKSEGKERAQCGRWYIRVYGELDHKPMVELESLEIIVKELHKVEEENRKLREKIKYIRKLNTYDYNELQDLTIKLNIKVASLEGEIKGLNYTIEELHKELDECECSFGFESDEVGFWKREYKRLKKWIKDHCKGYGNLFPEDEMKRQRKKADKKRKKYKNMEDDTLQELKDIGEI